MRKISYGLAGFALLALGLGTANAQDKVKIGIILPYSGQFADTAAQVDNAIKLYVKQHGETVAGKKIELFFLPDISRRATTSGRRNTTASSVIRTSPFRCATA